MPTDVVRPADPHDLIQQNWPPESESDYRDESARWTTFASTYASASGTASSAASHAAQEWLGQSGSTYVEQMHGNMSQLHGLETTAVYVSTELTSAEGEISHSKADIAMVVTAYTPEIDAALAAEKAGKKPAGDKSSADLIRSGRDAISKTKTSLDNHLDDIGKALARGGPPEEKPGAPAEAPPSFRHHTADEVKHTSEKPVAQPSPDTKLPSGAKAPVNQPLPTSPGQTSDKTPGSATPSVPSAPSMPSSPSSGGGSPASGSPSGGGSPAGAPSGGGAPSSGSPSGGGQGGNSQNNQNNPGNQNNSSTASGGDPLLAAINQQSDGIPFGAAPMTLSGVTQAIPPTISQVAAAAPPPVTPTPGPETVAVPSAAPMGTGVTPGIPGGPAVQPATMPPPSSTTASAVSGEAQGSTVTNATMSKSARMIPLESPPVSGGTQLSGAGGATDRRPAGFGMSGPGGGVSGGWVSAAAGAAAGAGGLSDTADMPVGGFRTFLADLGPAERIAHRALATLRTQFEAAGWTGATEQPVAVGVYRREGVRGTSFHAVYATADGVSLWPYGVKLPAGVHPVMQVDGIDAVQAKRLVGFDDPRQKISAVMPEGYGELVCLLDTVAQDPARYDQIISAGEGFTATQSRGDYARVPTEQVEAVLTAVVIKYEMRECVARYEQLQAEMIRHRWDRDTPAYGVEAATSMWWVTEAAHCLGLGMLTDAGYAIGQVQAV